MRRRIKKDKICTERSREEKKNGTDGGRERRKEGREKM